MASEHTPPVKLDAGKIRLALGDPDTPGLVLLTITMWCFGPAVFGDEDADIEPMDVAEMWAELHTRYNTWVTDEGENRLNAILTGLQDGMFWRDEEAFMAVCAALYDGELGDTIDGMFEDLGAAEILWAVLEMGLAADDPDTPELAAPLQAFVTRAIAREQEDLTELTDELEATYSRLLNQLQDLGVPAAAIRSWEEDYDEVLTELGVL